MISDVRDVASALILAALTPGASGRYIVSQPASLNAHDVTNILKVREGEKGQGGESKRVRGAGMGGRGNGHLVASQTASLIPATNIVTTLAASCAQCYQYHTGYERASGEECRGGGTRGQQALQGLQGGVVEHLGHSPGHHHHLPSTGPPAWPGHPRREGCRDQGQHRQHQGAAGAGAAADARRQDDRGHGGLAHRPGICHTHVFKMNSRSSGAEPLCYSNPLWHSIWHFRLYIACLLLWVCFMSVCRI